MAGSFGLLAINQLNVATIWNGKHIHTPRHNICVLVKVESNQNSGLSHVLTLCTLHVFVFLFEGQKMSTEAIFLLLILLAQLKNSMCTKKKKKQPTKCAAHVHQSKLWNSRVLLPRFTVFRGPYWVSLQICNRLEREKERFFNIVI